MDVFKYIEGVNFKVKIKNGEIVKRIYFNNFVILLVLKNVIDNLNCEIFWFIYINVLGIILEKNILKYENVCFIIFKFIDGDEEKDFVIYVKNVIEGINFLVKFFKDENLDKFVIIIVMEYMVNYLFFKVNFFIKVVGIIEKGEFDLC